MDDALFHVSQRLDALAADDEHAILYFSRVQLPSDGSLVSSLPRSLPSRRRRRRRATPSCTRVVGLSAYYVRLAVLVGAGWFLAAYSISSIAMLTVFTPISLLPTRFSAFTPPATIYDIYSTQIGRELSALSVGAAVGAAVVGSLADHYGRRRVLLLAITWWILAHVASAVAWTHVWLLAFRALEGIGLGGQFVLFHVMLTEFAAQRRRGRLVILSAAFVPLGALVAVHSAPRLVVDAVGWRVFHGAVLGGAETIFGLALALSLRESPRFLAATGRDDAAIRLVEAIECAHGINRNARVTMPSSLYDPPAAGVDARRQTIPSRTPQPGSFVDVEQTAVVGPRADPTQQRRRRRASTALTPGMVSLLPSLGKRWRRVLLSSPYASRSIGLTLCWLVVMGGVSATVAAAARFYPSAVGSEDTEATILMSCVASTAFLGYVCCAAIMDRTRRIPLLFASLSLTGAAATLVGIYLFLLPSQQEEEESYRLETPPHRRVALLALACSALSLATSIASSALVIWTIEHFGVLLRTTAVGLTILGSCLGLASGQWAIWFSSISSRDAAIIVWVLAVVIAFTGLLVFLNGVETRGQEDVDSVEPERGSSGVPGAKQGSDSDELDVGVGDHSFGVVDGRRGFAPQASESTYVGSSISESVGRPSSVRFSSSVTAQSHHRSSRTSSMHSLSRSSRHSRQEELNLASSLGHRPRGSLLVLSSGGARTSRLTYEDIALPQADRRLDPAAVRETQASHAGDDDSSSSSNDGSSRHNDFEHDMLTIDVDPFDSFISVHTPLPMLEERR
ncbi:hypothetical protein ATCC90586_000011 [Pythium insidiosum]|nr:hypothetical protein ATCC90586_000011 [Pythium insidiosum]